MHALTACFWKFCSGLRHTFTSAALKSLRRLGCCFGLSKFDRLPNVFLPRTCLIYNSSHCSYQGDQNIEKMANVLKKKPNQLLIQKRDILESPKYQRQTSGELLIPSPKMPFESSY